jgi:hypothetical protein
MQIIVGRSRQFDIDYDRQAVDVDAARGQVSGE